MVQLMPHSHYRQYTLQLEVLLGGRTTFQDSSYLPSFGVSIYYGFHKLAKLENFGTILSYSLPDLERVTQLSASDVLILHKAVAKAVPCSGMLTALDIYNNECPEELKVQYLSTGCDTLDRFLRGGILCNGITEIAGESASGKTQFCMQLCLTVQLPSNMNGFQSGAAYICTEDAFPNRRLMQMVQLLKDRATDPVVKNHNFTDHIYIEHVSDLSDMWHCITKKIPVLLAGGRVKLIVIDSIAALFRCEFGAGEIIQRAKKLSSLGAHLHRLSSQYGTTVVCVNQVSDLINSSNGSNILNERRNIIPALGISWANLVTSRLMFQRTNHHIQLQQKDKSGKILTIEANVRRLEILFAPHLANAYTFYTIDNEGVKALQE